MEVAGKEGNNKPNYCSSVAMNEWIEQGIDFVLQRKQPNDNSNLKYCK